MEGVETSLAELLALQEKSEVAPDVDPLILLENRILIGCLLGRLERYEESRECLRILFPLPREVPQTLRVRAMNAQAVNLRHLGEVKEAYTLFGQVAELAEACGDHGLVARVLTNQANLLHEHGDFETAIPLRQRALDHARQTADASLRARLALNLGCELARVGEMAEIDCFVEEAEESLTHETDPQLQAAVEELRGKVFLRMERADSALAAFRRGLAILLPMKDELVTRARLEMHAARALLELDRPKEALPYAMKAHRGLVAESPTVSFEACLRLAAAHLHLGAFEEAESQLTLLARRVEKIGTPELQIEFHDLHARWAEATGDHPAAIASLRAAIARRDTMDRRRAQLRLALTQARIEAESTRAREFAAKSRAEEFSQLRDELEKLHGEKEAMLTVVAHDLRSQLSAAVNFGEIGLLRKAPTAADLQQTLRSVYAVNRSTLELLNHLLSLEQLDHDAANVYASALHLPTWLRQVANRVENLGRVKGIHVVMTTEPMIGEVVTDETWLRLVVENYLSNAFKYSPSGTTVELSARREGEAVVIEVADRGPGIPTEEQANLFTKFHRAGSVPTGNEFSTGLGLYLVRRYASLLQAEAAYRDRPGGGSVFSLRLPASA